MDITWRGNKHTNKSSRFGHNPISICNHITGGTASSADSWFRSSNNHGSSAHFLIKKNGEINQYVLLQDKAWCNGLTSGIYYASSELVNEMYNKTQNPNNYTVSIEHEGTNGELTEKQFKSTVWLHRFIRDEVKRTYGYEIKFNRKYIIGHYEVDRKNKPFCPGNKFPWERLINELNSDNDKINFRFLGKEISSSSLQIVDGVSKVEIREFFEKLGFVVGYKNGIITVDLK